ncbi:MAG TPA: 2-oxoglutarate dehydrogenase, E2 component, dihydrolipoamide succinyltransferase [Candidatus Nanopelagicaceae bacterium]
MTFSVTMPALGESVSEGTVTRWLKAEGDHVAVDEPLLEVSTDKVDTEIPSPVAGILQKIVVAIDQTVPVGAELAVIADSADAPVATPTPPAPVTTPTPPAPVVVQAPVAVAPVAPVAPVAAPTVVAPSAPTAPASSGTVISMPALGESVSEGTVTRWLKNVGDTIAVDEALLEVSTDKVDTEIPSPVAGIVLAIEVPIDTTVPVGARLAVIGSSTSAVVAKVETPAPAASAPTSALPTTGSIAQPEDAYVTPLVRKLASDLNVDLSTVQGTGVGGRIRKEDIQAAEIKPVAAPVVAAPVVAAPARTPAPTGSPLRGQTVTMSRLRKVIAARMVESLHVSAQLTTVIEVDVTKIARLRNRAKANFEAREGVNLTFLPFFAVAVCDALKQHPVVNSSVDGDQITYHAAEHLGIAVDTERGLLVPVIRDAGNLNIGGIAQKISDLAARTRDNKISPDELGGGTFTITNTGSRGALFDTPIINQPQVAILGLGAIVKRPVVIIGADDGETIAVRSMVYLALSYDHRVVDGADAARFLVTLKERLETGAFEADLGL